MSPDELRGEAAQLDQVVEQGGSDPDAEPTAIAAVYLRATLLLYTAEIVERLEAIERSIT